MSNVKIIRENSNAGGMVYCLGIIGAIVYYWQQADTFWQGVVGFFKALVWPAFLVHKVLETLNM